MNINDIRKGVEVWVNNRRFGTVEDVRDNSVYINGQQYPLNAFSRFENNRLYLNEGYQTANAQNASGVIEVPVAEEQLKVGKRDVQAGEVDLQKRVVSEQVNVPVDLRREEVRIEQRDLPDRPAQPGEMDTMFREGTIRVPVTAEEAVVSKEAYVTGEVVVNKEATSQRQTVSDTVRREEVEVVNDTTRQQAAGGVAREQGYTRQTGATTDYAQTGTTRADYAQPSATTDYAQTGTQVQVDQDVYASDGAHIGKVKEVYDNEFEVGRGLFKGNAVVPFSAITGTQDNGIQVSYTKEQIDNAQ